MRNWRDRATTATAVAAVLVAGGALAAGIRNALFETAPVRAGSFTPSVDGATVLDNEQDEFDTSSTTAVEETTTTTTPVVTASSVPTTSTPTTRPRATATSTTSSTTTTSTTVASTTSTTDDDRGGNSGRGRGRGPEDD